MTAVRKLRRQNGATIIAALLVVAAVSVVAANLIEDQARWFHQVKLEGDRLQALALGDAAIDYGRAVLADDERRSVIDHRDEAWAQPLPPMSVEGGLLAGSIEDMQGRLNLNDILRNPEPLHQLWLHLGLPIGQLAALSDWIDPDSESRFPDGAEDPYYLDLDRPYRAGNGPLVSVDELIGVRGFTPQAIELIREHVAVYPAGVQINVNLASPIVLRATIPDLTMAYAERLRRSGDRSPFKTVDDFMDRLREIGWNGVNLPPPALGSRYFLVRGEVRWGDASVRMSVAVERTGGGSVPRVVWKRME